MKEQGEGMFVTDPDWGGTGVSSAIWLSVVGTFLGIATTPGLTCSDDRGQAVDGWLHAVFR